jgi:hypothetical protein
MRKFGTTFARRLLFLCALLLAGACCLHAEEVTLEWKPSPDPRTSGYILLYGTTSGAYDQSSDVGGATSAIVSGLAEGQTYYFAVYAYGGSSLQSELSNEVVYQSSSTAPVSRLIFYNNSAWDGYDHSANDSDDSAIATDKTALLPGGVATFSNYTSYSRGLNGIMVDLSAAGGTVGADDFVFKAGNDSHPSAWPYAPAPSAILTRPGAGNGGADRVTIIWPDNVIYNQWLEVTVRATPNTGLSNPDVFYFGNAIGEAGNSSLNAAVTSADALAVLNNLTPMPGTVTVTHDFNRDKKVTSADALIALNNLAVGPAALQLIAPNSGATFALLQAQAAEDASARVLKLAQSEPQQLQPPTHIIGFSPIADDQVVMWFWQTRNEPVRHVWRTPSLNPIDWQPLPDDWLSSPGHGIYALRMHSSYMGPQSFFLVDLDTLASTDSTASQTSIW